MPQRPTRDQTLQAHARVVAERSSCSRGSVGALFALDGRVLVTGYNGTPAGMDHCNHECDCGYPGEGGFLYEGKHLSNCPSLTSVPCKRSVHAEANAIAFAAKHGVQLLGSELVCTHTPCVDCAKLIVNVGCIRLWAGQRYRDDKLALELLSLAGIPVVDWEGEALVA